MISPRQRLRADSDVPVLFRLPNLRTRGSRPAVEPSHEAPLHVEFEPVPVEMPAPKVTAETAPTATRIEPRHETVAAPRPVADDASPSRSWMERVGSRLILVVTLLVIVTAAWLTGRQMPAGRLEPWNDSTPVETQVATTGNRPKASSFADAAGETVRAAQPGQAKSVANTAFEADPATSSTAASLPPTAAIAGTSQPVPDSADSWAHASKSESTTSVFKTHIEAAAASSPAATLPVFNTVSLQSSGNSEQPVEVPYQSESIPLAAPLSAIPTPDGTSATGSATPKGPENQTSTPHAPAVDPKVLVPWFSEQVNARQHRKSGTPNAITDWSKYLSNGSNGQQTVRAVSSDEPAGSPGRAQQAVVPQGVIANPYGQ